MVRMTPCVPCCESCVIEAFQRAGAAVGEAFVIVSGIEELEGEARARYVESVMASMEGRVHLVIETPAPQRQETDDENEADADGDESTDDESEKARTN